MSVVGEGSPASAMLAHQQKALLMELSQGLQVGAMLLLLPVLVVLYVLSSRRLPRCGPTVVVHIVHTALGIDSPLPTVCVCVCVCVGMCVHVCACFTRCRSQTP